MTSNHVLGLKAVVLPTARSSQLGGESHRDRRPGSGRTLRRQRRTVRHRARDHAAAAPAPESYHTVLAGYRTCEQAGDAVRQIVASGLLPGAMEIMDPLAIEAAEAAVHADYPPGAAAVLIVELEGDALEVDAEFARLDALIAASGADEHAPRATTAERARIWKGRKSAFTAVGRLSPDFIVQDGVVPRTPARRGACRASSDCRREHGIRVANVFHAGDGNLHPLILFDGREAGALERAEGLAGDILRLCIELGGSITGEHGVGMEKRAFLGDMFEDADIEFMQRLRDVRSIPQELANRGKMLAGEAPARQRARAAPAREGGRHFARMIAEPTTVRRSARRSAQAQHGAPSRRRNEILRRQPA